MTELTVTMLGRPGSGKTTYLHAMYAQMTLGIGDFGLLETDWDRGLELDDSWRALTAEGILPPPTDENPQFNEFILQCSDRTVALLRWADFRGGALHSRADRSDDSSALRDRLVQSDSIHLVLDGDVLADATFPADIDRVGSQLGTERMSAVVRDAVRRRPAGTPAPSLVVLITKTDRILEGVRIAEPRLEEIFAAIERMLPVIGNGGLTTMICPIRVGRFGRHTTGTVDPATLAPEWLHQPVLFTVMHHLFLESRQHHERSRQCTEQSVAATAELGALEARPFGSMRSGPRRRELAAARLAADEAAHKARAAGEHATWWFQRLRSEIDIGIPVYHRGHRQSLHDSR